MLLTKVQKTKKAINIEIDEFTNETISQLKKIFDGLKNQLNGVKKEISIGNKSIDNIEIKVEQIIKQKLKNKNIIWRKYGANKK